MKTILWYSSLTGHTELYADWLGKEIRKTPMHERQVDLSTMMEQDIIIYGGPVHFDIIVGFHRLKKIISHLEKPKIIIFAVGAAPESDRNTNRIKVKNFNGIDQRKVTFFYLRGGFDLEKLPGRHRITLYMYKLWVMRKDLKTLTDGERSLLATYSPTTNYSEKSDLKPIVDYIKGLYNETKGISPFRF